MDFLKWWGSRALAGAVALLALAATVPQALAEAPTLPVGVAPDMGPWVTELGTKFGVVVGILVGIAFAFLIVGLVIGKARKYVGKA